MLPVLTGGEAVPLLIVAVGGPVPLLAVIVDGEHVLLLAPAGGGRHVLLSVFAALGGAGFGRTSGSSSHKITRLCCPTGYSGSYPDAPRKE